jgi:hypothetical protein
MVARPNVLDRVQDVEEELSCREPNPRYRCQSEEEEFEAEPCKFSNPSRDSLTRAGECERTHEEP